MEGFLQLKEHIFLRKNKVPIDVMLSYLTGNLPKTYKIKHD